MIKLTVTCCLLATAMVFGGARTTTPTDSSQSSQQMMGDERQITITEVGNNGQTLTLSDGSMWRVSPNDVDTAGMWMATQELTITRTNMNPDYPYKITNSATQSSVNAQFMGGMRRGMGGQNGDMGDHRGMNAPSSGQMYQ